jgi:hypothetical protein
MPGFQRSGGEAKAAAKAADSVRSPLGNEKHVGPQGPHFRVATSDMDYFTATLIDAPMNIEFF